MQAKFSDGMELRKDWILARLLQISLNHKKWSARLADHLSRGCYPVKYFLWSYFLLGLSTIFALARKSVSSFSS